MALAAVQQRQSSALETRSWPVPSLFLVCLAYANLCFANAWKPLESRYFDYFLSPPLRSNVALRYMAALLCDTLLLAVALWAVYALLGRSKKPYAFPIMASGFLLSLLVPLNLVRTHLELFQLETPVAWAGVLSLCILLVVFHRRIFRPAAVLVLVSWPLIPIEVGVTASHLIATASYSEPAIAGPLPGVASRRLVWVIFDEFDQYWGFTRRPAGVMMPNLDALARESFTASQAQRAARETLEAIPSLFLGREVTAVNVAGPVGLHLQFRDGGKQSPPFNGNIFDAVRKRGLNAAISGWYHPYCRLFHDSLAACLAMPAESGLGSIYIAADPPYTRSFAQALMTFPVNLAATLPGAERLGLTARKVGSVPVPIRAARQIEEFRAIRDAALKFAADPHLSLVYIHVPAPHNYGIFNPRTGALEYGGNYFDNFGLVDRTVGDLRETLLRAGLWDSTSVLISSDHSLRYNNDTRADAFFPPGDERTGVPFILHLAGAHAPLPYDRRFNALLTRDLALAILSGEVATPEQAARFIDTRP